MSLGSSARGSLSSNEAQAYLSALALCPLLNDICIIRYHTLYILIHHLDIHLHGL